MKTRKFQAAIYFGLLCCAGFNVPVHAQVYTGIVGYINLTLYPGNNLIANQLGNSDNSLTAIFPSFIPEGTTFTKWDAATGQYLPLSTYDTSSGWSINYELNYGEGGLLHSPSPFTNTFAGEVWPEMNRDGPYNPPLISSYGILLLSCYVPFSEATFHDVVGRDPQNGESVTTLNPSSQISSTTIYEGGSWNNGDPLLNVGQSAFFDLEPVPEPEVCNLLGAGVLLLASNRRMRKR